MEAKGKRSEAGAGAGAGDLGFPCARIRVPLRRQGDVVEIRAGVAAVQPGPERAGGHCVGGDWNGWSQGEHCPWTGRQHGINVMRLCLDKRDWCFRINRRQG